MEMNVLILAALPWLLLLACPLAMWWMMRGMGNGGHCGEMAEAEANGRAEGEVARLRARVAELETENGRSPA